MSQHRTAEEILQENIDVLGDDLGKMYYHLWQEVAYVYSKWSEYVELYGKKESRVELLNKAAPRFFRIIQDSLFEDTILHISRLTDPPKSVGKSNLSINQLPLLIKDHNLKQEVENLISVATDKTKFCRDWRNRKLAHKDLSLSLKDNAKNLEPATRIKIKEALASLAAVLNALSHHYHDSETHFDSGIYNSGGAEQLLYIIDDGLKMKDERMEALKRGEYESIQQRSRNL